MKIKVYNQTWTDEKMLTKTTTKNHHMKQWFSNFSTYILSNAINHYLLYL